MFRLERNGDLTPIKPRRAYAPPKNVCGAPCHYGGLSAARKYSRAELGLMYRCNRGVAKAGDRCWQHPA